MTSRMMRILGCQQKIDIFTHVGIILIPMNESGKINGNQTIIIIFWWFKAKQIIIKQSLSVCDDLPWCCHTHRTDLVEVRFKLLSTTANSFCFFVSFNSILKRWERCHLFYYSILVRLCTDSWKYLVKLIHMHNTQAAFFLTSQVGVAPAAHRPWEQ